MKRQKIQIGQTIATIVAEERFFPVAEKEVRKQRKDLEEYIRKDPAFLTTLDAYTVADDAPEIVRRMAAAANRVGVGPMAAVAGAIAEQAVLAMEDAGATHAVFDNGGDIALLVDRPLIIGIYTGNSRIQNLGFRIRPQKGILGVCTSSSTVGPSLSLGMADAAVVLSKDPVLGDAAATALGNAVVGKKLEILEKALDQLLIEELEGLLVIADDMVGMAGRLPELCRAQVDYDLITKG